MNLLKETLDVLQKIGKHDKQITFIGSLDGKYSCTFEEFKRLADRWYNCGYGAQEVASDLIIIFDDKSYLERSEYDGSECWSYRSAPIISGSSEKMYNIFSETGWDTLEDIHQV